MNLAAIPKPRERRRKGSAAPAAVGLAAVYVRVSVDETTGSSLTSQEAACRALCDARGLDVAAVYRDNGWSGGNMQRPGLSALRKAVDAGNVAFVVVYAVDRLSRRQTDTLALLEQLSAAGAGLISASQPFETSSAMGKAMVGFLAIFAELQREDIRSRTRQALARKKAEGLAVGRTAFGLRIDADKRYAPDPATWPTVLRILSERAAGGSCQRIANRLNADGIESPGGSIWSAATVARLCRSAAVLEVAKTLNYKAEVA